MADETLTDDMQMILMPNPTVDQFRISLDRPASETSVTSVHLYNVTGQQVKQLSMTGNNLSVDVSDLATGIYIVHLIVDGQVQASQKLSIVK